MTTLYQLHEEWLQLQQLIDSTDGEMPPEVETTLDSIEADINTKVENICFVVQNLTAAAVIAKDEADRLARLADIRMANVRRLKAYLMRSLQAMGIPKVETDLFRVRVQKNPRPSISWPGMIADAPEEYVRVVRELNGQAAYEAWKAQQLPEGFVVEQGSHLRIS